MARNGAGLVLLLVAVLALCIGSQKAAAESSFDMDASRWLAKVAASSSSSDDLVEPNFFDDDEGLLGTYDARRSLAAQPVFISYGSLNADTVVCPAGSGRSYYTPNCYLAPGPPNTYTRGCSTITRCARSG